jgi:hypothetical protein
LGYAIKTIQVYGNIKEAVQEIVKNIPEKQKSCLINITLI